MSVKLALAKLSATAAGTAMLAGGAVHVAEQQVTDTPIYKSGKVQSSKTEPVKYIKERRSATRVVPKTVERQRRIVRREVECEPVGPGAIVGHSGPIPGNAAMANPAMAGAGPRGGYPGGGYAVGGTRSIGAAGNPQCAPAYRMALAAIPAPIAPLPQQPFRGGWR